MATRHERVVLTLDDNFTTDMARAATATALLDRSLKSLSGSAGRAHKPMQAMSDDVDKYATNIDRALQKTTRFDHALSGLSATAVRSRSPILRTADDVERVGRSADRSEHSINQLTGRLRVMADIAAVLGPSLVPIAATGVPAVTGLASQLGFAGISAVSLWAATRGVGDALKAVVAAKLEPTAANLDKAREAMSQLGPDARKFVRELRDALPVLRQIRDAAAAGWFPGLTDAVDQLEKLGPRFGGIMQAIGERGGRVLAEGAAALAGPQWDEFWSFVAREAPDAVEDLLRTVGNLGKGLAELWMAFQPTNNKFGDWLLEQSRDFAKWAEELKSTEGFRDFIDYIETNGPRVAAAAGAIGDAILQIIEAVAPLGGPSLKIIELFGKAIAMIADSDLGTPILAGVAALAIYNRTLQATAALQTRLTGAKSISNAVEAGGLFGVSRAGAAGARTRLAGLRQDISLIGASWATAGARTERETRRMNAAIARTKTTLAPLAKTTAVVGGLAVATTGVADSFGLANTASLALMGSIAGPWGAAIGGGVGLMIDLAKAIGDTKGAFEDAIKTTNAAANVGDLATAQAALEQARKVRDQLLEQDRKSQAEQMGRGVALAQAQGQDVSKVEVDRGPSAAAKEAQAAYDKAAGAVEALENKIATASLTERGYTAELLANANAAGVSAAELWRSAAALEARTQAALGAFSAETRWRQALRDAQEQANTNNDGIHKNTEAADANRAALEQLVGAWNGQRDAMVANNASTEAVEKKYRSVRKAFIDTALDMNIPIKEARRLAATLLLIPEKKVTDYAIEGAAKAELDAINAAFEVLPEEVRTDIEANGVPKTIAEVNALVAKYKLSEKQRKALVSLVDKATPGINAVIARLADLRDKSITVSTTFRNFYENVPKPGKPGKPKPSIPPAAPGFNAPGSAEGSTVPDDGRGYRDYLLYRLAPREEVISNRAGQADEFRPELKDINRGMSRREVAERMMTRGLATGGTTGKDPSWVSATGSSSGGRRGVEQLEKPDRKGSIRISYVERASAGRYFIELANGAAYMVSREGLKGFKGWHKALRDLQETGLKGVTRALKRAETALDNETRKRDDLVSTMSTLSSAVRDRFTSDIFPETDVWAKGGSIEDANRRLDMDTAEANRFNDLVATLRSKGLDGPALDELLARADMDTIANFAAGSRDQLADYERKYELRSTSTTRAGKNAATAAYGKQLDTVTRSLGEIRDEVRELRKEQKHEQQKNRESRQRGNSQGNRRRNNRS